MKLRTINEAAAALNTTREKLRRGVQSGLYPSMAWGTRTLVDIDVLGPMLEEERARDNMASTNECAAQIGISPITLRKMAEQGVVPSARRGGYNRYCFDVEAVKEALRKRMTNQPQK